MFGGQLGPDGQQRQGAEGVDQRWMFTTQAEVAGAQIGVAPGDVVLLVHSRRLAPEAEERLQGEYAQQSQRDDGDQLFFSVHAQFPPYD